jgi:hypothetical protein
VGPVGTGDQALPFQCRGPVGPRTQTSFAALPQSAPYAPVELLALTDHPPPFQLRMALDEGAACPSAQTSLALLPQRLETPYVPVETVDHRLPSQCRTSSAPPPVAHASFGAVAHTLPLPPVVPLNRLDQAVPFQ